jgi:hypothetical protein
MSRLADVSLTVPTKAESVVKAIDGDVCGLVNVDFLRLSGNATTTLSGLVFNVDTGSNYNAQELAAVDTSLPTGRATRSFLDMGHTFGIGDLNNGQQLITTKLGTLRKSIGSTYWNTPASPANSQLVLIPNVWSNVAQQLRILSFTANKARGFGAGSRAQVSVYRNKP